MAPKKTVHLKDLKTTFFVRTQLDQEYVLKLADLYEADVKLPPIKVTSNNEVIDGRHRKEAMELAFNKDYEAEVEFVSASNPVDLIIMAYEANEGGPLPNSRNDMIHTLQMLLSRGASERAIYEKFSKVPRGILRKYIEPAKRNLKKGLIQQAKEAVAAGEGTVKEIATRLGLDALELRRAIAGPKVGVDSTGLAQMKSSVSQRSMSLNRANQALVRRLVVGFADGDVQEKVVDDVLDHIESLTTASKRRLLDWRNRFNAAKNGKLLSWNDVVEENTDSMEAGA